MPRETITARRQIDALFNDFIEKKYYQAADLLLKTVERAYKDIDAGPASAKQKPQFTTLPYLWILRHRYWFAWAPAGTVSGYNVPIVTNVFWDREDIPNKTQPVTRVL